MGHKSLSTYFLVGLLTMLLIGGDALAQRGGDRGGGRDRGRSGDSGGRSWSGGGSSRSMSAGRSSSGGSSRSMSSGRSSRSMSAGRSAQSFSRGSSRESSRGGGRSAIQSFSRGSSFSEGSRSRPSTRPSFSASRGGSSNARSFSDPSSFARSSNRGSERSSASSGQTRNRAFESLRSSRDFGSSRSSERSTARQTPSSSSSRNRDFAEAARSFGRGNTSDSPFTRSFDRSRSRGEAASRANNFGRRDGDESRSLARGGNRQNDIAEAARSSREGTGSARSGRGPRSFGGREFTAARPTDERVRDFLQLRRDNASRQADRGEASRTEDGSGRRGRSSDIARNLLDSLRERSLGRRGGDNDARSDWSRRLADRFDNRDVSQFRRGGSGRGEANWSRRFGDGIREVGRGDSRRFGDRDFVNRKYDDWRKSAWRGDRGHGRDHRDWSGRWKDGHRFSAAHRIRDHWKGHRDFHKFPFHGGWWRGHHGHRGRWDHWDRFAFHRHRPFHWWSWCTPPLLTSWINYGWSTPYYWDYGPGEYIYCYDDVVYVNGVWFQPASIYHDQALVLAQRAPTWTPEEAARVEWLPLGVFAMTRDGVADNNVLVQLAVTQDGVIGGTVLIQATGATYAVEGTVDKDTQRAVWSYADESGARVVMESSIFNLTQPESTGLIHFGADDIQVMQLVRLEEPDVDAAAAPSTVAAPQELPPPAVQ
jgi:hypothetical protein